MAELYDLHILGEVVGFIGKVLADDCPYLLVITESQDVGVIGPVDETVHQIKKIVAVPVIDDGVVNKGYLENSSNGLDRLKNHQKKLFKFVTRVGTSLKIIDEVTKLVNDSGSFYYCTLLDLTLSTQR